MMTGEVHVWRASLDLPRGSLEDYRQTLSDDEKQRADRFYFSEDRDHFIAGRGILRAILSRYLKVEPARLVFDYSPHGKPFLPGDPDHLRFNASHSGESALYALSRDREVGVDLEKIRANLDCDQIAGRYFSKKENDLLQSVPYPRRYETFFTLWTGKEAWLKAIGMGVSVPLDRFDVSGILEAPKVLLNPPGGPPGSPVWSLGRCSAGEGYAAALAVQGDDWRPQSFQFREE